VRDTRVAESSWTQQKQRGREELKAQRSAGGKGKGGMEERTEELVNADFYSGLFECYDAEHEPRDRNLR